MRNLFVRRQGVEFQKMVVMASAMTRPENAESVKKALTKLSELMFPEDEQAREAREESMRETLRVEGQKSYKVERMFVGDRRR